MQMGLQSGNRISLSNRVLLPGRESGWPCKFLDWSPPVSFKGFYYRFNVYSADPSSRCFPDLEVWNGLQENRDYMYGHHQRFCFNRTSFVSSSDIVSMAYEDRSDVYTKFYTVGLIWTLNQCLNAEHWTLNAEYWTRCLISGQRIHASSTIRLSLFEGRFRFWWKFLHVPCDRRYEDNRQRFAIWKRHIGNIYKAYVINFYDDDALLEKLWVCCRPSQM